MTYYDILGVACTATQEEIHQAYWAQIKFFHPDIFGGSDSVARAKTLQLNEAYGILVDEQKRKQYDLVLLTQNLTQEQHAKEDAEKYDASQQTQAQKPKRKTHIYYFLPILLCVFLIPIVVLLVSRIPSTDTSQQTQSEPTTNTSTTIPLKKFDPERATESKTENADPKTALEELKSKYGVNTTEPQVDTPASSTGDTVATQRDPKKAYEEWKSKYGVNTSESQSEQPPYIVEEEETPSDALKALQEWKNRRYGGTMPSNGDILISPVKEQLCPLSVSVMGNNNYYIYLDCMNGASNDMSFMVSPNSCAEVLVPLGEFEIYYTYGNLWGGTEHLFGSSAPYYKCEGYFSFYDDGQHYQGWSLELYPQTNGNMDTEIIPADQFPNKE